MSRNLNYQFKNAIDESFNGGGVDKHSAKHTGNSMGNVYSYAERSNLLELSHQIGDYVKVNYGVRMVKDIQSSHVQNFLNSKAETCNANTLSQYASRINKLESIVNNVYHVNTEWNKDLIVPPSLISNDKTRDVAMTRADYNSIMQYAQSSNSQAKIAIELAGRFGMRVAETCKLEPRDINFNEMKLHIHESKGGRSRDIPITAGDVQFLKSIIGNKTPEQKIVNIKEDSVNRFLSRIEEKLGIEKYKTARTGIHSIRKMTAQEKYDQFREHGFSKKESMSKVSEYLGHGKDRIDIVKAYISNIH